MKEFTYKVWFIFITLVWFVSACNEPKLPDKVGSSFPNKPEKKKLSFAEEEEIRDSIQSDYALSTALKKAEVELQQKLYETTYNLYFDSLHSVKVEMRFGNLFQLDKKHLLVKRKGSRGWVKLDLFGREKDGFEHLLGQTKESFTYVKDTIFDVNGDNEKDYVIEWYPSSGCCRRKIFDVFLKNNTSERFLEKIRFVNPTFSPTERVVRGVGYGQPGEVGLYKYKWDKFRLDTLEYIYPDVTGSGFFKTKFKTTTPSQDGFFLKYIPKEYRNIESYDWFENF